MNSDSFSHHHGQVKTLRVQHLQGDPVAHARGLAAVAHALSKNRGLETLMLSGLHVDVGTAHALSDGLAANAGLRVFECHRCGIDDEIMEVFAGGLEENWSLHTINLSYNRILDVGARALATALQGNRHSNIHSIVLHGNDIHYIGLRALAKMLEVNTKVTLLGVKELHRELDHHVVESLIVPGLIKNRNLRDKKWLPHTGP